MELTDLRYFLNVAACQSFARAAKISHVTPPAISKTIKKLEAELATKLFVRTTRSVVLTDAGKILQASCLRIVGELDALEVELNRTSSAVQGELRIAAMEVFSNHLLPAAISDVVRDHPKLVPCTYEMIPQRMEELIQEGRIDVGFTIGDGASKRISYQPLGKSSGVLVCGRAHSLYASGRVSRAALTKHPSVVPRFLGQEHLPSLDQFTKTIERRVGATIELLQMGVQLVVQGAYIGYFPEVSVRPYLERGSLKALKGLHTGPPFVLYAMTRADAPQKAGTAVLIERVKKRVTARLKSEVERAEVAY